MDEQQPRELRRHVERAFGYAVEVPADFVVLLNTVDPLSRLLRGLRDKQPDEETALTGNWPVGFADPRVVGDIGGGHTEPLRLLEFDVLERPDPLSASDLAALRQSVRGALPQEVGALGLPGFESLGARELRLGQIDALGLEYEWDGPSDDRGLRDRGLVVWAPTPTTVFHVYYHCPTGVWPIWWPELEQVLASFELVERSPAPAPADVHWGSHRLPGDTA
jgi:hypothetical protein